MSLKISNQLILQTAKARNWPTRVVDENGGIIAVTPPGRSEVILKSSAHPAASIAQYFMAEKKQMFHRLASAANLPVPESVEYIESETSIDELVGTWNKLVVKPQDASHGNGVTVGCTTAEEVKTAIAVAEEYSSSVLLQQQVGGNDYRVLVIGAEVVAVTRRRPAFVRGDGTSMVRDLIVQENASESRAEGYSEKMNFINEKRSLEYLGDAADTIPVEGEEFTVLNVPNIGQGGQAINETDRISEVARQLAIETAGLLGLRCAGVDFLCEDIGSDDRGSFSVIEVNAIPSLSMHQLPHVGEPVDVASAFLDEIATL